jgi:hypothetical protein
VLSQIKLACYEEAWIDFKLKTCQSQSVAHYNEKTPGFPYEDRRPQCLASPGCPHDLLYDSFNIHTSRDLQSSKYLLYTENRQNRLCVCVYQIKFYTIICRQMWQLA